jgi:mannose-1-phosphate guanylyltransferase
MLCVHADWAVADPDGFRATLARAADVAERHAGLVTVGIVPTRPDPGFGYIQPGAPADGASRVARFVEKPDRATAERMVREGFLWNSGIFVWRVGDFLSQVAEHCPEVAPALPRAVAGDIDAFFATVTPISVDHGVLERSACVFVLPGDFGWDDVGTWAALHRVRAHDDAGNAVAGDAHLVASQGNVVHAEEHTVVLYGVRDLVVVSRDGLTLVTTREHAADLKALLDALPSSVRDRR